MILYVQSDILLLADVFESFRNMYFKIHEFDPAKCVPAPGLAWQAALEKAKVKLDLLTGIDMLLFVERGVTVGVRRGICHTIHHYAQSNNKHMKEYDKNREFSYLQH